MLQGIDIYQGSGKIDWVKVKQAGISFCFIRAAYGDRADSAALDNLRAARAAGLVCGVYHFIRASKTEAAQIALMKSLVESLGIGKGDLPPVIDVEDNPFYDGAWDRACNASYLEMVKNWTQAMQARLGAPPIIYTRASFWQQLGNPKAFADNPLWVASYRADQPRLPDGWQQHTFWQYSESGVVEGLRGQYDLSYFHSADPEALRSLALK